MQRCAARVACAVVVAAMVCTHSAAAATIGFTIIPAQSELSLSGVIRSSSGGVFPINPSVGGSLLTDYTGTVSTDSDLSSIVFMGAAADASVNGMHMPGPASGDYGLTASLPSPLGNTAGAFRNLKFSMTGPSTPLFNGFDLAPIDVTLTAGTFESTQLPTMPLSGASATLVSGTGTLFQSGDLRRLHLPLSAAFEEPVPGTNYSIEFTLSGLIVASRTVPEPTTGLLLLSAVAVLVTQPRRRFARTGW